MDLGKIVRNLSFGLLVAATTFSPAYAKDTTNAAPKGVKAKKLDLKSKTFATDATIYAAEYLNAHVRRPAGLEDLPPDPDMSNNMKVYADYLIANGQKILEREVGKINRTTGLENIFPFRITLDLVHTPNPRFTNNVEGLKEIGKTSKFYFQPIKIGSTLESRIGDAVNYLAYLAPNHRSSFSIPSVKGTNAFGFTYAEAVASDNRPYFMVVMAPKLRHSINSYKELLESGILALPKVVKIPLDNAEVNGRLVGEHPNPGNNPKNEYGFCPGVINYDSKVDLGSWTVAPGKSFVKYDGKEVSFVIKEPRDGFNYTGPGVFLVPPVAKPGTNVEWGTTLQFKKNGKLEELPISGKYTTK